MNFHFSYALVLLLVLAFLVAIVLTLSVITKSDEGVEHDRANTTRATLLLLTAFVLGLLALIYQRYELADSVKSMLA